MRPAARHPWRLEMGHGVWSPQHLVTQKKKKKTVIWFSASWKVGKYGMTLEPDRTGSLMPGAPVTGLRPQSHLPHFTRCCSEHAGRFQAAQDMTMYEKWWKVDSPWRSCSPSQALDIPLSYNQLWYEPFWIMKRYQSLDVTCFKKKIGSDSKFPRRWKQSPPIPVCYLVPMLIFPPKMNNYTLPCVLMLG